VAISLYRPDLMVMALSTPTSGAAGRTLAIANTVKNVGPAPATAFTVRFYLSTDDVLDEGDVLLGARSIGGLATGAMSSAVTTVTIPANTSVPATYRVLAVVDALDQQAETDETNNVMATATPMTITAYLPELNTTALSAPAGASAGHTLSVTHTVKNSGPAPAGAFTVRFYLSADDTFDASDVLLGARNVGGLGAGASSPATTMLTVPAGTVVPDPYFVIAVVDALGQQAELDETNNVTATSPLAAGTATASAR
jgi:subtilase family serine protease